MKNFKIEGDKRIKELEAKVKLMIKQVPKPKKWLTSPVISASPNWPSLSYWMLAKNCMLLNNCHYLKGCCCRTARWYSPSTSSRNYQQITKEKLTKLRQTKRSYKAYWMFSQLTFGISFTKFQTKNSSSQSRRLPSKRVHFIRKVHQAWCSHNFHSQASSLRYCIIWQASRRYNG